jgi:KUP system potassium uptake protein
MSAGNGGSRRADSLDATTATGIHLAPEHPRGKKLALLTLGALGVVYGDIGTSPLYAVKFCFNSKLHPLAPTEDNILGILSLVFWALTIIISFKYVTFVMRADNRGEGGVLSLMALAMRRTSADQIRARHVIVTAGLFGAALLYGDGMITPAISVLSAIEGLKVIGTGWEKFILPLTVIVLIFLFLVQSWGTHRIGRWFGPIVLTWFAVIALLGARGILLAPEVFRALNPIHGMVFLLENHWIGFVALSSVFLAVTGGEALYADMGHFGRRPIRVGWYAVAMPALLLNYFGQGALLLSQPSAKAEPFFYLVPQALRLPLVLLATLATSIASQAVISGAFSMTKQAIQLGYLPRMEIRQTSHETMGQVYVPQINWLLAALTIGLVLYFKSSEEMEGAYGFAVSTTMVITTFLLFFVARRAWDWSPQLTSFILGFFLIVDIAFFTANLTKIEHGGLFPLMIGITVYVLMSTWRMGRDLMARRLEDRALAIDDFIKDMKLHPQTRVKGVSVFMTSAPNVTPVALLHNVKNNHVVHDTVVLLAVKTEEIPYVRGQEQVTVDVLGEGFFRVNARCGFMDTPDIQQIMDRCRAQGFDWPMGKVTFFLGRTTLLPTKKPGLPMWRKKLFAVMARNSERATAFFRIPPGRVVELGMQVEL